MAQLAFGGGGGLIGDDVSVSFAVEVGHWCNYNDKFIFFTWNTHNMSNDGDLKMHYVCRSFTEFQPIHVFLHEPILTYKPTNLKPYFINPISTTIKHYPNYTRGPISFSEQNNLCVPSPFS